MQHRTHDEIMADVETAKRELADRPAMLDLMLRALRSEYKAARDAQLDEIWPINTQERDPSETRAECARLLKEEAEAKREREAFIAYGTQLAHTVQRNLFEAPKVVTEDGMYQSVAGIIYKVQKAVHGSGGLYAKKLVQDSDGNWSFAYAPGAIRGLTPAMRMTPEQAKEFGQLYGICCRCAAPLTDETSIERGMGPICAGKL